MTDFCDNQLQEFEQLTILYNAEKIKTNKGKIDLALRFTFKKFILLKNNTNNDIIHDLMQFTTEERSATNIEIAKQKLEARLARIYYTVELRVDPSERPQERKGRFLPKELQQILNLMIGKCTIIIVIIIMTDISRTERVLNVYINVLNAREQNFVPSNIWSYNTK